VLGLGAYTGIDIGAWSLKAVSITGRQGAYSLKSAAYLKLPPEATIEHEAGSQRYAGGVVSTQDVQTSSRADRHRVVDADRQIAKTSPRVARR